MKELLTCRGDVQALISFKEGGGETLEFRNTILRTGREALALSLANRIGDDFDFFINRMLFGNGGATGGVPKVVSSERNGLFGTTVASKPVVANIDPNNGSQVIFTSVVSYGEGNGYTLNEMALQLHNGDLYSMATFPGVTKTSQMQITWNWRLSFI
jgi:hypothetical protein